MKESLLFQIIYRHPGNIKISCDVPKPTPGIVIVNVTAAIVGVDARTVT